MQRIDGTSLHVIVDTETLQRIDKIAQRQRLKRSQAMRRLMQVGCDVYEDLEAVGFVKMSEIIGEARRRITPARQLEMEGKKIQR